MRYFHFTRLLAYNTVIRGISGGIILNKISPIRTALRRAAAVAGLCLLSGLFLIIPSVSSDNSAADNHPLRSNWRPLSPQENAAASSAELKIGSFRLRRPANELFLRGLGDEAYGVVSAVLPSRSELENYLKDRNRHWIISPDAPPQSFRDWLLAGNEGTSQRLLLVSADYVTNYLAQAAQAKAQNARFIRQVEWDYQTALGERPWQGGLSALGALRESDADAIVWQLRGYAAEKSSAGANAGLIYRRALDSGLLGANVFVDYERHGDANDAFTRWSLGGEYRNAYVDLVANRYFAVGDAISHRDDLYYQQDGSDVQLNINAPPLHLGDVSGGLTYYHWQGEYGDGDDEGLRYHLRFAPAGSHLNVELELDSPDGGGIDKGARISYRHAIGGKTGGGRGLPQPHLFDAREHFFDSARREYAQRIRRTAAADDNQLRLAAVRGSVVVQAVMPGEDPYAAAAAAAAPVTLTAGSEEAVYSRRYTLSVTVLANSTLQMRAGGDWGAVFYPEMDFLLGDDSNLLSMSAGTIFISHRSGTITLDSPHTDMALLGTRLLLEVPGGTASVTVQIYEGTVSIQADYDTRPAILVFQPPPGDDDGAPLPPEIAEMLEHIGESPADGAPEPAGAVVTLTANVPAEVPPVLMVGCDSGQQRDHHRIMDEGFAGCRGDALISGLAPSDIAELITQGETLTLSHSDDGGSPAISVASAAGAGTVKWQRYPFSPHESVLHTYHNAAVVSYGIGADAEAVVTVNAGSRVVFRAAAERAAAGAATGHEPAHAAG